MVTCPNCICNDDPENLQLKQYSGDYADYFYCKVCKSFMQLQEIDADEITDDIKYALVGKGEQ